MTALAEIQAHIASMSELHEIVGAMRSLASMRLQEAQRALPGTRRYAEAMADAIGAALLLVPVPSTPHGAADRRALILYAAAHGFVGGFSERLVEEAAAAIGPKDILFVLGGHGAALLAERGRRPAWSAPMATRPAGTLEMVRQVTGELYRRIARQGINRVDVVYARYRQGASAQVARQQLLPLDLASLAAKQPGQPPLHNLTPTALLERLMAEYVFALLTEAAVESLAAENAARFAAMESAHDNVSKKLEQLRATASQARQTEITTELLDVVTGAEALTGG